jgi:GNAT superfamily N-acetyltransferase
MPANPDLLQKLQFRYLPPEMGRPSHQLIAETPERQMGLLEWTSSGIRNVNVRPDLQRQGVATALYRHAQSLAKQHQRIPQPKHSMDRTTSGDAWAKAVGGRRPRDPGGFRL